jgi:hypothetical protein
LNKKELKDILNAQKVQLYLLTDKNRSIIYFNGLANLKLKYNENNILIAKNMNFPDLGYTTYYENEFDLWLSLTEQLRLQYNYELKMNQLEYILFSVNSFLTLLNLEENDRLIKSSANLQLEDEQVYLVDKHFISFFINDFKLWVPYYNEIYLKNIFENEIDSDNIFIYIYKLNNKFEFEILKDDEEIKSLDENEIIKYNPKLEYLNNIIFIEKNYHKENLNKFI